MAERERPSRGLTLALFLLVAAAGAALWLPRWWENRAYREAEAIAGVGAPLLPGGLTDARKKIDAGASAETVTAALGRPSFAATTKGSSRHDIWTYHYADGTLTVNMTDGVVIRIAAAYGAPRIPASRRPR